MGSRRKRIYQIEAQIVYQSVENFEISLAEVTRQVGVSTFDISEALTGQLKIRFKSVTTSLTFFTQWTLYLPDIEISEGKGCVVHDSGRGIRERGNCQE